MMGSAGSKRRGSAARCALATLAWLLAGCGVPGLEDGTARLLDLTASGAQLAWRTPRATPCRLQIGLAVAGETGRPSAPEATPEETGEPDWAASHDLATPAAMRHRARVEGLAPDHTYHYRIACEGLAPFSHRFRTLPEGPAPLRIAVLGDSGKGSRGQHRLARAIDAAAPALVLHTGDVLYEDDERAVFVRPYAALLADTPLLPATGNHDLERWERFVRLFDLPANGPAHMEPGRSYWLERAGVRIVVIDSNHGPKSLRYEIGPWLAEVLARKPAPRFRIVVMHHPPYTWGRHEPILPLQQEIVPLLEAGGVDLVLSGHDHNYQRSAPLLGGREARAGERGIVYVVTGAGGGELYEMESPASERALLRAFRDDVFSFTRIDVGDAGLDGAQIDAGGEILDRFHIPAQRAEPAALPTSEGP